MNGQFPYDDIATKLMLAIVIGLLVGLERQWAHKETGVRTFSITATLGMLASLIGPNFVLASLGGVLVIVAFVNIQSLRKDGTLELTTSVSLMVVLILGAMIGQNHYFTAATSAILLTMLLTWKVELSKFADALLPEEIRGAVLFGLISFVIFPLLPNRYVDPWELLNPRQAWVTVIVIAGLGFVNYILLRLYSMRGMYYAAILGGLVNSSAAVTELSRAFKDADGADIPRSVAILLLTSVSMFLRNIAILAIFAPRATEVALLPLGAMIVASILIAVFRRETEHSAQPHKLQLSSPLSLFRVLTFAVLFVIIAALGTLA